MHAKFWTLFVLLCAPLALLAQQPDAAASGAPGGWVRREIVNGDTTYIASLNVVKISAKRTYKDRAEQDKLARYRRYAQKAYPLALEAIDLYADLQEQKGEKSRRQYRRYARGKKSELKSDWETRLKDNYKEENLMLIKMVERQTGQDFYGIVKEAKGLTTAIYWNSLARTKGVNLKDGYQLGQDAFLDEVLLDYDFGDAIWKY